MRQLIILMNVTLDGFIAGPDGGLEWQFNNWTTEMADALCSQLNQADTILLGKNTYCAMAAYWPSAVLCLSRDDTAFAGLMNSHIKIVCSSTLSSLPWNNSRQLKGNIDKKVHELKQQAGKDIILFGSCRLAANLIKHGLVDQYQLWVYPVAIGSGITLFNHHTVMKLLKTHLFSSGVVALTYAPAK
jgi:dihydrofolate reductase